MSNVSFLLFLVILAPFLVVAESELGYKRIRACSGKFDEMFSTIFDENLLIPPSYLTLTMTTARSCYTHLVLSNEVFGDRFFELSSDSKFTTSTNEGDLVFHISVSESGLRKSLCADTNHTFDLALADTAYAASLVSRAAICPTDSTAHDGLTEYLCFGRAYCSDGRIFRLDLLGNYTISLLSGEQLEHNVIFPTGPRSVEDYEELYTEYNEIGFSIVAERHEVYDSVFFFYVLIIVVVASFLVNGWFLLRKMDRSKVFWPAFARIATIQMFLSLFLFLWSPKFSHSSRTTQMAGIAMFISPLFTLVYYLTIIVFLFLVISGFELKQWLLLGDVMCVVLYYMSSSGYANLTTSGDVVSYISLASVNYGSFPRYDYMTSPDLKPSELWASLCVIPAVGLILIAFLRSISDADNFDIEWSKSPFKGQFDTVFKVFSAAHMLLIAALTAAKLFTDTDVLAYVFVIVVYIVHTSLLIVLNYLFSHPLHVEGGGTGDAVQPGLQLRSLQKRGRSHSKAHQPLLDVSEDLDAGSSAEASPPHSPRRRLSLFGSINSHPEALEPSSGDSISDRLLTIPED